MALSVSIVKSPMPSPPFATQVSTTPHLLHTRHCADSHLGLIQLCAPGRFGTVL